MTQRHGPVVVKLGGSLAQGARFAPWLAALTGARRPLVLVPGGGPFADQVRAAQRQMGFDDRVAHHLALIAMEQFGLALASQAPGLVPAASKQAIRQALREQRIPVWLPTRMALGRPEIAESWDVTSDSLALWLAGRLGAKTLLLIKSAPAPAGALSAADLARRGLIDAAFPGLLAEADCRACYVGPDDRARLAAGLAGQGDPGRPIAKMGSDPISP